MDWIRCKYFSKEDIMKQFHFTLLILVCVSIVLLIAFNQQKDTDSPPNLGNVSLEVIVRPPKYIRLSDNWYKTVHFFDAKSGIVASSEHLLYTGDGGANWGEIALTDNMGIADIQAIDKNTLVILDSKNIVGYKKRLLITKDRGKTFSSVDIKGINNNIDRVIMLTDKVGMCFQSGHSPLYV